MDLLKDYLRSLQAYKLLEADEEAELSKKIENGDKKAVQLLVQSNLRLVVSVAKKFTASYKFSVMDLIQEGNMGLMAAANKFHYSFKTRFSTYAYTWILQYMLRFIYGKTSVIALPHRKEEMIRRVNTVQNMIQQQTGKEPTIPQIAEYIGMDETEVAEILAYSFTVSSLDAECNDDSGSTVGDLIPDSTYNPEEVYLEKEKRSQIRDMVKQLPEKEQAVIYSRYNFDGQQHVPTLRELSDSLGVSAETIRQMELRAVKKMRKSAEEVTA